MKKTIAFIVVLISIRVAFGQDKEAKYLLQVDSTWTRETFDFPLNFAPTIDLDGIEEACFPKGWADSSSSFFWSYVFVWEIKTDQPLTGKNLEQNLQTYFNGLLNCSDTKVSLKKQKGKSAIFKGKIFTIDWFFTKKKMTLNVTIENKYNKQMKTSIIVFRFSLKQFDHMVWEKLKSIKLINSNNNN